MNADVESGTLNAHGDPLQYHRQISMRAFVVVDKKSCLCQEDKRIPCRNHSAA